MSDIASQDKPDFTLSESAKQYIQETLPTLREWSAKGIVPSLTFSGSIASGKDGLKFWELRCPVLLFAAQKPDRLPPGKYCEVMGVRVWVGENEQKLLAARTLTTMKIKYGDMREGKYLVIGNAPVDYFESVLQGGKA